MGTLFGDAVHLTDGGMETTLIYHDGIELPDFAAFTVLASGEGRAALAAYYDAYLSVAEARGLPIVLDTPTWRASSDWGARLGYSAAQLAAVNREAVAFLREACAGRAARVVVSGAIGPRGDGYVAGELMSTAQARDYHAPQVDALTGAGVELISALTMTYAEEAAGIATAVQNAGVPVAISFTVETDGTLPSGQALCLTDDEGRYSFTTIKPGAYPWRNHDNAWRPAHIHFSLFGRLFTERLVTQMYFPGDPLFVYDPILNAVRDATARELLIARFDPERTEPEWALAFEWDVVMRATPFEP